MNGYIRSSIHLLSCTKKFVRYFLREKYNKENIKNGKSYCKMLDIVFSEMWRNQDLGIDSNFVDIK